MLQADKKHPLGVAYIGDHVQAVLVQPILDADGTVMGKQINNKKTKKIIISE